MGKQFAVAVLLGVLGAWCLTAETSAQSSAPGNLTAQVSGDVVTLSWSPAAGSPTSYIVEAGSASGLADLASFLTGNSAVTFVVNGVPNGTYFVRVRATGALGTSPPSNEITVVVGPPCAATAAPTGLSASVSGAAVTLAWNAVPGATSYQLEAGSAPAAANVFSGDVGLITSLTAIVSSGTYYVRVRSKTGCATSAASADVVIRVGGGVTVTFQGAGSHGSAFASHSESGVLVEATQGNWTVSTGYGNPAPFIQFTRAAAEETTSGEVRVTVGGGTFAFSSVDVYSSITPIPVMITGLLNSSTVFSASGTVPNTFGQFATVSNPYAGAQIDTLIIHLSNPATPCCSNPVGIDNIVVVY
jgi:hypothetical protein